MLRFGSPIIKDILGAILVAGHPIKIFIFFQNAM
jgi:hypothetical protein